MKIANLFHSLIFYAKGSILDVLQGFITEYASGQKAVNYVNLFNIVLPFTCFLTFLMTSRRIQNPFKLLRWRFLWKQLQVSSIIASARNSILDVWLRSECAFEQNIFQNEFFFLELEYVNYYYYSCKWSQLCQFISRNKHKKKVYCVK